MSEPGSKKIWQQVQELFDQLVERSPAEQTQVLAEIDDVNIKHWVKKLLIADALEDGLLDRSVESLVGVLFEGMTALEQALNEDALIGMQFGAYRIVGALGQGGMSVVMLAERNDGLFEKQVALKLIQPGPLKKFTNERLAAETRILAHLQHPNIAHLLDAGVNEDGIAFTALEYCKGLPLTQYCDEHRLTVQQRLKVLITICDAVHEAHRNLIVHRDLKPSNILVQDNGMVKLLDFGISSMLDDPGLADKVALGFTPEYAAPEQFSNTIVNTASDIYTLGIIAYELLTGMRPFDHVDTRNSDGREKLLQAKLNNEFLSSSNRVKRLIDSDHKNARVLAEFRGFRKLRAWTKKLTGDLDHITAKALAAEPGQRYSSAQLLIQDLQAHLDGLPTIAHPAGFAYRFKKAISRHRWTVAAGTFIATTLLLGLLASSHQAQIAQRNALRAESVKAFVLDLFEAADPVQNQLKPFPVNDLIDIGIKKIETSLTTEPSVKVELLTVLASIQSNLGNSLSALALYKDALEIATTEKFSVNDHIEILHGLYSVQSQRQDYEQTKMIGKKLLMLAPIENGITSNWVQARNRHTEILIHDQRFKEAVEYTLQTLEHRRAIEQLDDAVRRVGDTLRSLSRAYFSQGNYRAAGSAAIESLPYLRSGYGEDSLELAIGISQLSSAHLRLGEFYKALEYRLQALEIISRLYPADHNRRLTAIKLVADAHGYLGQYEKSFSLYKETLNRELIVYDEGALEIAITYGNLAHTSKAAGDFTRAIEFYQRALELHAVNDRENHFLAGLQRCGLAATYAELGDVDTAILHYEQGLAILDRTWGPEHPRSQNQRAWLALQFYQAGKYQQGKSLIEYAYPTIVANYAKDSSFYANAQMIKGVFELQAGDLNQGAARLKEAEKVYSLPRHGQRYAHSLKTIAEERARYELD